MIEASQVPVKLPVTVTRPILPVTLARKSLSTVPAVNAAMFPPTVHAIPAKLPPTRTTPMFRVTVIFSVKSPVARMVLIAGAVIVGAALVSTLIQ